VLVDLKIITLPEPAACPSCDELIDRVLLIPVVAIDATRLKSIVAVCLNCGMGHDINLDAIATAAADEAMKHLHPSTPLAWVGGRLVDA
jgi:hypothetical protein